MGFDRGRKGERGGRGRDKRDGFFEESLTRTNERDAHPHARWIELDRIAENARRYESWRGGRTAAGAGETTGADVMRAVLRRQVMTWAAVGIVGVVLIVAGFAVR